MAAVAWHSLGSGGSDVALPLAGRDRFDRPGDGSRQSSRERPRAVRQPTVSNCARRPRPVRCEALRLGARWPGTVRGKSVQHGARRSWPLRRQSVPDGPGGPGTVRGQSVSDCPGRPGPMWRPAVCARQCCRPDFRRHSCFPERSPTWRRGTFSRITGALCTRDFGPRLGRDRGYLFAAPDRAGHCGRAGQFSKLGPLGRGRRCRHTAGGRGHLVAHHSAPSP